MYLFDVRFRDGLFPSLYAIRKLINKPSKKAYTERQKENQGTALEVIHGKVCTPDNKCD